MIKTFSLGLGLLKVWIDVKLESSNCNRVIARITIQNLQGSIDLKLDSIDRKSCINNFLQNSQTIPSLYDV